jgi:hypothetical protein
MSAVHTVGTEGSNLHACGAKKCEASGIFRYWGILMGIHMFAYYQSFSPFHTLILDNSLSLFEVVMPKK